MAIKTTGPIPERVTNGNENLIDNFFGFVDSLYFSKFFIAVQIIIALYCLVLLFNIILIITILTISFNFFFKFAF